ncbi:MAG TPA: chemotaxis protein CheW [Gemmatimonadaceae bacterium]|nr:chemotaxis protein CheW [Gemmatimonadaceae bacterium]
MRDTIVPQVVTFRLGEDLFAADIYCVERVLRYQKPTTVPNVPEWVEGVIEYQNRVVPVVDLRERFGLERCAARPETRIIIFAIDQDWVAARVDSVLEVVSLGSQQLAPPPPLFRGLAAEYLRGILRMEERLIVFLDVPRLLSSTDRLMLREATEALVDV